MKGSWIDAAGFRTWAIEAGSGAPLILLHGAGPGADAEGTWRLNLPYWAKHRRVIAPDIFGFGSSKGGKRDGYDLATWRRQIRSVADALGVRRFDLAGISFGGALAMSLAAERPERIRRLVLLASAGTGFAPTPELRALAAYRPSQDTMTRLFCGMVHDRTLVTESAVAARFRHSIRPGAAEAFRALMPPLAEDWLDRIATPSGAIRALAQPTLILHGREDRVIPAGEALRLGQWIERAETRLLGRCGHWVHVERAGTVNTLVAGFLAA